MVWHPVVIIGNEKVRINNESDNTVIRASELYNLVERLNLPEKYDEQYQNKVQKLLIDNNMEEENVFSIETLQDGIKEETLDYTKEIMQLMYNAAKFEHDVTRYGIVKDCDAWRPKQKIVDFKNDVVAFIKVASVLGIGSSVFKLGK